MKYISLSTRVYAALSIFACASNTLIAMESAASTRHTKESGWEYIQDAFDEGILSVKKDADTCNEVRSILATYPELHLAFFKHMTRKDSTLLASDLWLIKASVEYCLQHHKNELAQQASALEGLSAELKELKWDVTKSKDYINKRKENAAEKIAKYTQQLEDIRSVRTQLKALLSNCEKATVESLKVFSTTIFTQDAPQEETTATAQTTPNTVRTLIRQASYDKSAHIKQ